MPTVRAENINNNFFDGHYKDVWRSLIPEALTKAEVDYLVKEAGLKPGNEVLDLMCGYGRHALSLGRLGIKVTAVDNLIDYVNEMKEVAQKENLPITVFHEDVLQFQSKGEFDLIICMGNSMSFFNKEESEKIFSRVRSSLKKNGRFIFNSWMISEIVIKQFKENFWTTVGGVKCLYNGRYLLSPARIETESIFIVPDGSAEKKQAVDYIYSLNETEAMLGKSGLAMKELWSIPGKKQFAFGDSRVYVVAGK